MRRIAITISTFLMVALLLSGCMGWDQAKYAPGENAEEIWVCERPFFYFSWNEEIDYFDGMMSKNGEMTDILLYIGVTGKVEAFTDEILTCEAETMEASDIFFFVGKGSFKQDIFICEVEKDLKNTFDGKLPKLEFKRYNKEEYIREHGEL